MKKWIRLLLVLSLLLSAACALSEEAMTQEAQADEAYISYASSLQIGSDRPTAVERYKSYWAYSGYNFGEPENEVRTLSNGKVYAVQTFTSGEMTENGMLTGKLYFSDGMLAAGVNEFTTPEGIDPADTLERLTSILGTPKLLSVAEIGIVAELLGEDAHLENGQNLWTYTTQIMPTGTDTYTSITMCLTAHVDGDHIYMAEWPAPQKAGNSAAAANLSSMKGYDELTEEEKASASKYADFLESQVDEQLQKYIDFLLQGHSQGEQKN